MGIVNTNRGMNRSKSKNSINSQHQMSKKDIECWNCEKKGHYKNECKAAKKDKDSDNKTSTNVVLEESNDALICSLESKTKSWVLNLRASFHATSSRELFQNYVSGNLGKVYLGYDQACDVIGKGEV